MEVQDVQVVATAAVREAANGQDFLKEITKIGFSPLVLSGEEEAEAAGYGVLSTMPEADGIAGDLGGGSLELIRICNGEVHGRISLPFGSLRIPALRAKGPGAVLIGSGNPSRTTKAPCAATDLQICERWVRTSSVEKSFRRTSLVPIQISTI